MDGDRRRNGDQQQRGGEVFVGLPLVVEVVEDVDRDHQVENQINVEDHHVPRKQRPGPIEDAEFGDEMPEAVGTADIHGHEQQAHADGRYGQQLAENGDLLDRFPVVDVRRNDQQHRRRRNADQEGEIGDVEAPGNLVPHGGHAQTVLQLVDVSDGADGHQGKQGEHPRVIGLASFGNQDQGPFEKVPDIFHYSLRPVRSRRNRKTWVAYSGLP